MIRQKAYFLRCGGARRMERISRIRVAIEYLLTIVSILEMEPIADMPIGDILIIIKENYF